MPGIMAPAGISSSAAPSADSAGSPASSEVFSALPGIMAPAGTASSAASGEAAFPDAASAAGDVSPEDAGAFSPESSAVASDSAGPSAASCSFLISSSASAEPLTRDARGLRAM